MCGRCLLGRHRATALLSTGAPLGLLEPQFALPQRAQGLAAAPAHIVLASGDGKPLTTGRLFVGQGLHQQPAVLHQR